ncbi:MAG: SDR family oxidoreductase [Thaumarchaeota archaeon]|nr:SDR family oxidoreductase [Nitrososphaerota archaeon]
MKLKGAKVVLTGVSGGVGLALLRLLVSEGALVVGCSRHKGELTDADIKKFRFNQLDVSVPEQATRLINSATKTLGGIDVLINNASVIHELKNTEDISHEEILHCFSNNVFATFNTLRNALPIMKAKNSGLVINVSSRCGRRAVPKLAGYCSTKFAIRGITEAVAKEAEGTGVRSISISPAGINTKMRVGLFGREDAEKQQSPERVAEVLCSIIRGGIQVPNGADIVLFKDKEPIVKVPES